MPFYTIITSKLAITPASFPCSRHPDKVRYAMFLREDWVLSGFVNQKNIIGFGDHYSAVIGIVRASLIKSWIHGCGQIPPALSSYSKMKDHPFKLIKSMVRIIVLGTKVKFSINKAIRLLFSGLVQLV